MGIGVKAQSIDPRMQYPSQCRCFLRDYDQTQRMGMRWAPKQ
jgi:hypothetical protein